MSREKETNSLFWLILSDEAEKAGAEAVEQGERARREKGYVIKKKAEMLFRM